MFRHACNRFSKFSLLAGLVFGILLTFLAVQDVMAVFDSAVSGGGSSSTDVSTSSNPACTGDTGEGECITHPPHIWVKKDPDPITRRCTVSYTAPANNLLCAMGTLVEIAVNETITTTGESTPTYTCSYPGCSESYTGTPIPHSPVKGTATWTVNGDCDPSSANGTGLTAKFTPRKASSAIGDRSVVFTISSAVCQKCGKLLPSVNPITVNFTVVKVASVAAETLTASAVSTEGDTKTLLVPYSNGLFVLISAKSQPQNGSSNVWPSGKPVWTPDGDSSSFIFTPPSPGKYTYTAECGNQVSVIIRVIGVEFSPSSEMKPMWKKGETKSLMDNLSDDDNFDKDKFAFEVVSGGKFVNLDTKTGQVTFTKDLEKGDSVKIRAYSTELPDVGDVFTFKTTDATLDISVVSPSVAENIEETQGAFIMVNDDDDNGDINVDSQIKYESSAGGENDLREARISYSNLPEISTKYPVTLRIDPFIGAAFNVWDNPNRTGNPLLTTYGAHVIRFESASDVPKAIYAEGTESVTGGIRVLYYHPDTKAMEDKVKITSVKNNIKLEGLPDEKIIRQDGQIVRIEPYEFSTGAYLQINTDRLPSGMRKLSVFKPSPDAGLPAGSIIEVEWDSDKIEIRKDADLAKEPLASPIKVKLFDFPNSQVAALSFYVNPVKESGQERDIVINSVYICPDGTVCEDKLAITNYLVNLRIDSNNDGTPDENDDKIEDNSPGKIIAVNQNDGDNDGVVDYADLGKGMDENFAPLNLTIGENFDLTKLKVKLNYSGLKNLPDEKTFEGKMVTFDYKEYRNYTAVKKGNLRIWKIEDESTTRSVKDIADGGNYIVPNKEYNAVDIFGDKRDITLYTEGINTVEGNIILTVKYENSSGIIELTDKVKTCVVGGDIGVNTDNDITFKIGSNDDMIEDQLDGFIFWKSRDTDATVTEKGIIDLFPLRFEVPDKLILEGWKFYLDVDARSILPNFDAYENRSMFNDGTDRIACLKSAEAAGRQLTEEKLFRLSSNSPVKIDGIEDTTDNTKEFLLKCSNTEKAQCRIVLMASPPDFTDNKIELDSVKVSIKPTRELMHAVSARGTPNNPVNYPTEKGRQVENYNVYPYPEEIEGYAELDARKDKILVFIHGYNLSQGVLDDYWPEMFKRFYWTGYRGNLVAISWEGDQLSVPVIPTPFFGKNMENALQTSWPVADYLTDLKLKYPKQKISISCHSLGNLVAMDALRLIRTRTNKKIIENVLHTEAAVWKEVLDPRSGFVDNGFAYSVDKQQKVSWRHWFLSYKDTVSATGKTLNSHNSTDRVLTYIMRFWQAELANSNINFWEDLRSVDLKEYRTPYLLWHNIPGWPVKMEKRLLIDVDIDEIQLPMGANGNVNNVDNIDGNSLGWKFSLSDFGHSSWETQPYYEMYNWFNNVLNTNMGATGN